MRITALTLVLALAHCVPVFAQDYPNRTITLVVPAPPGGATDVLARVMADEMGKRLKRTVIVDNKPGASGMLGAGTVARAAPDGYTLLLTHSTPIYYTQHIFSKMAYDSGRDFAFITEVGAANLVLAVNKNVPVHSVKEFISWAQKNKGKVNYGSFGIGSTSHLLAAYLSDTHQLDMSHIAYKGEALMTQDIISGQIPVGIGTPGTMGPHLANGSLRALAIMGNQRQLALPDVPTMPEAGFPDLEYQPAGGVLLLAPAKTPAPILALLEKEARAAVQTPAMQARFQAFGITGIGNSSVDFRKNFDASGPMIQKLVKVSGAKVD